MQHWLSYSHADQALLRDLTLDATWDALVVPGTLAAFYFEGTGGFILSKGCPYIIDPRTPLLQTIAVSRPAPKKSHLALAAIHDPDVCASWPDDEIEIEHWQDGRWPAVVRRVIHFQERYSSTATAKVDKYATLLAQATGRELQVSPEPPHRLVPPYWAVEGVADPWWALSKSAIQITLADCGSDRVLPIIATTAQTPVAVFAELIADLPNEVRSVFCWRGSWDETRAQSEDLEGWASTIEAGRAAHVGVGNLYGGYLSILLSGIGLGAVNHGIGYSEQRDVRRLGETGAPPTRYYVPVLRTFVSRANAQPVVDFLPPEWACRCEVCQSVIEDGIPIVGDLSVEALKRHFLLCRHDEMERVDLDLYAELDELDSVGKWLAESRLPQVMPDGISGRLRFYATAIRRLAG